jgi:ribosomal protein S18 acetylase RimI-like enzyme
VTSDEAGLAGFVLVTSAPRRLERRTVARHPRIWLRTAAVGLRSPSLVTSVIRRLRSTGRPSVPVGAEADPALRLLDIAVARRAQGHGHGRMLLAAGLEEAWRRGYEAIGLSVLDENRDAIRLYERAGFRRTGGGLRADGRAFQVMRLDRPMVRPASETARTEAALPAGAERVAD